ncbi:MAG: malonyl-CoA decarboxylase [bacterium]|nr:malonyl-CoA decarboxylase [bacterium]
MTDTLSTWEKIKSFARITVRGKVAPDLPDSDVVFIKEQIHDCVFAKGGEIAARTQAVQLGTTYLSLSPIGRERFLEILAHDFDIHRETVNTAIENYQKCEDDDAYIDAELELVKALVPPRMKLLKQFNTLPDGFKFLIDLRAELMPIRKRNSQLKKLNADLKRLLSSWFDVGLLDLEAINWNSPASLLEKLISYEAVHEIRSWSDLRNRLDSDRRCFAFFHNKIPNEPLIFVEVALVRNMAGSIQEVLEEESEALDIEQADTAVFYSISNAQKGLTGISLGNLLIKRVVKVLSANIKSLKHFVTLSPIPLFRKWLNPILETCDDMLTIEGRALVSTVEAAEVAGLSGEGTGCRGLAQLLDTDWKGDPEKYKVLKPILMRLCAYYLMHVKRGEKAFDPVANFHLSNGARIERINWLGDTSEKGMKQSAGMMINYYYDQDDIEKNHELYASETKIQTSREVRKLL